MPEAGEDSCCRSWKMMGKEVGKDKNLLLPMMTRIYCRLVLDVSEFSWATMHGFLEL